MDAILGASSTSNASASSVDSFSANTGMQLHWIP
jgi:myb proto-oncogene protein